MISRRGLIATAVLSAASIALLWGTRLPLGIPGEWTWDRIDSAGTGPELIPGVTQAAIAGTVYILYVWLGSKRISFVSRTELGGWLIGLVAIAFAWQLAVQEAPTGGRSLAKAPFVLYYPAASGYFHRARYEIKDTAEFLADYEELMAEGDVLHLGTHPPGLFVFNRALIRLQEMMPGLSQSIMRAAPDSVSEAFDTIDENLKRTGKRLSDSDRAVLWSTTLITQLFCVGAVLPLFQIIRNQSSRKSAWKLIAFWPLLPALSIFIPKSDVLFVLPASFLIWAWLTATTRDSLAGGLIAGAIGWSCLFCSLAFLPIGLIAFVTSVVTAWQTSFDNKVTRTGRLASIVKNLKRPVAGGVMSIVGLTIAVRVAWDINLVNVWIQNYRNHAAFYDQYQRTAWQWVLINPIELLFAVGAPFAVLVASSVLRPARDRRLHQHPFTLAVTLVWGLLWFSGKNSGEAARLWIPLMTTLPIVAAACPSWPDSESERDNAANRGWLAILIIQSIVCVATVTRVTGFHS